MITTCDPINPYTFTDTFGVPYNGGYKPDRDLQWIPPDTNLVDGGDADDTFMPPPVLPPPNMLMQTCEGRRMDPRVGGIPKREMEFDDFTMSQDITPPSADNVLSNRNDLSVKEEDMNLKMMFLLAVLLFVLLAVTRLS